MRGTNIRMMLGATSFLTDTTVSKRGEREMAHAPVMNVVPVCGLVEMMWSRETGAPGSAFGSEASGRQPYQAESTSERLTRSSGDRYVFTSFKIHSIS